MVKPRVIIIGGGGSGAAIAYDCALRGFKVLLLEKGSFTSGTTGRHHGLLHSGARYVGNDLDAASECWQEAQILRRISSNVIEDNGGYFVGIKGIDNAEYAQQFEEGCRQVHIPIRTASGAELAKTVPALSNNIMAAYAVPDASFDAWRLPMQFFTSALAHGATLRQFCEVTNIEVSGNEVRAVHYRDYAEEQEHRVKCDIVINAAGVWAARVAALCSISIAVNAQAGSMIAVKGRISDYVINRLAPAGNGDIVVPQRALSIIGTTSYDCEDIDAVESNAEEVDYLLARANELFPTFSSRPLHAVWAAARPLAGAQGDDPRLISRKLCLYNHQHDGAAGFFSIIGGKATTLRAMAEEITNEVCCYADIQTPCATATHMLLPFQEFYAHYQHTRNTLLQDWGVR